MLARPQFKEARENFNKKVQDCIDKGYLVEPKDYNGDLEGEPLCYQPYSFALKDEEKLLLGAVLKMSSQLEALSARHFPCLQTFPAKMTAQP